MLHPISLADLSLRIRACSHIDMVSGLHSNFYLVQFMLWHSNLIATEAFGKSYHFSQNCVLGQISGLQTQALHCQLPISHYELLQQPDQTSISYNAE